VGIGLALVKELTESLGGSVKVESDLGAGSKFTVVLPIEFAGEEASAAIPLVSPEEKQSPGDEWLVSLYRRADLFIDSEATPQLTNHVDLARRKRPLILIGEDQPDMAAFIASQLNEEFDVLIAADGQYAIDMTRQYKPDLLVLDLMMPEKDGLQVCRELQGEVKARGLPILVLTARADDETKLTVLQSGATDFLTKPFSTTELQTRCRNLVALALLGGRVSTQNQELRASMEQIKESEVRMVQHAKMISLGRMSAGLIHEINNPLNYVLSALRLLKRKCQTPSSADSLDEIFADIDHGLKRVVDLVSGLRTFSHPNAQQFADINLLDSIEKACRLTSTLDSPTISPMIEVPPDLVVRGNSTQLSQVWINIIQNAMDACIGRPAAAPSAEIHIKAEIEADTIHIKISDNGGGISPDVLDKVFDPFFTTKDVGSGMGLGLSICHAIIKSHTGRLDIESDLRRGTTVTIILPAFLPAKTTISQTESAETHHESLIRL
jgi:signal transduction histidine kinase